MKKEKKELLQRTTEKFITLDADVKAFVAGYMTGRQEEKAKWERNLKDVS